MTLDKEAREFNEDQKTRHMYYETEGRGLSRIEDELRQLRKTLDNHLGFLIDTLLKWIEDDQRNRDDEYRRSTYGMYDPFKYRTKRGHSDTPMWEDWAQRKYSGDQPVSPYDPSRDPDRGSFDEGTEDGKEQI